MLRRLIIVAWSTLLCLYLPAANAGGDTAPPAQSGGVLFKVQNGQHSLYLFGTIHVGTHDFYPLAPTVMHVLEQAPAIALEIDPSNNQALQAAVRRYGLYPPGQSSQLSEPLRQQVVVALGKYRIAPDTVAGLRPWMIATLLTVQQAESRGYHAALAVDNYLADFAHQHHQSVLELEGAAAQLALLGGLDSKQQHLLLEDTIKELNDAKSTAELNEIIRCWRQSDLQGLQALLDEMTQDHRFSGRFAKEVMIDQRNPVLAARIAALLSEQEGVFAAIGILHLAGPNSVPALLAQHGLKVERIF